MIQKRRYLAYLLRLWQESSEPSDSPGGRLQWRASLEGPQSAERQGFASLEELFAFLEEETRLSPSDLEGPNEEGCQAPQVPGPLPHERGWSHR